MGSRLGHVQVVEYLVTAGADLQLETDLGHGGRFFPGTPVHLACVWGHIQVLDFFIEKCGVNLEGRLGV